jgi:hypothetical protein
LNEQLDLAREAAILVDTTQPMARSAYYDRATGQVVIHLRAGSTFMFAHELGQGLAGATPDELADLELTPSGIGLHWKRLGVDLEVAPLLQGSYGTHSWMEEL